MKKRQLAISLLFITALLQIDVCKAKATWKKEEESREFWNKKAKEELRNALKKQILNTNIARNVILFIGDGMSLPTIAAARILKGQKNNHTGEETNLAMEGFPHVALSKTYSVDRQVTDSGSSATAILCGVKNRHRTIGVTGKVSIRNCKSMKGQEVDSVLVDAFRKEKSTGIITTTSLTHATPSASYAHVPYRWWYNDRNVPRKAKAIGCKDIAQQFYDRSHMITVALGGGRRHFSPNTTYDPEYTYARNARRDGQDLIEKWKLDGAGENRTYVWNKQEFDEVDPMITDRLWGMFQPSDLKYDQDRWKDKSGEPSIAEMTEKAIQILQKNENGYFLLVEGGRIDHAHHRNSAFHALHETLALDGAIKIAADMTSEDDTLIIVTADHSHTMSFGGSIRRGNPILGKADRTAADGKSYTSLTYGNGPGYQGRRSLVRVVEYSENGTARENLAHIKTDSHKYRQQTAVPLFTETHGGDDVVIMARGPMAHLFHGVHENNYIAHVIRYSACIGTNDNLCNEEFKGRGEK